MALLAIHQHPVEIRCAERLQGSDAAAHATNLGAASFGEVRGDLLIDRVILSEQHAQTGMRGCRRDALRLAIKYGGLRAAYLRELGYRTE